MARSAQAGNMNQEPADRGMSKAGITPDARAALENRLEAARARGLPENFTIRPARVQAAAIIAAVLVGPVAGWAIAKWVAPGSGFASFIGFMALPLVLGAGYAVWRAAVASILIRTVSRGLLRALYSLLVKRTRPKSEDVLPDAERISAFLHESIRAAGSFARVGLAIGIVAGILMAIAAPAARVAGFVLVFAACALYGRGLTHLAREGYLPMPDE